MRRLAARIALALGWAGYVACYAIGLTAIVLGSFSETAIERARAALARETENAD